jgi:hypothetical protein
MSYFMKNFRIKFNWGRTKEAQWVDVTIWDVHPNTFQQWGGGRWAYFEPGFEHPRKGKFGELHVVESGIREDTVAHEMIHVALAWYFAGWVVITPNNEERFCERVDELVRKFYREYRKQ